MQPKVFVIASSIVLFSIAMNISTGEKIDPKKPVLVRSDTALPGNPRWVIPDTSELGNTVNDKLIKYGRDLIVNTSLYFGPKGIISHQTNGLNCQNCHLQAGTKLFGNNFSLVASGYPRFKERSGTVESIEKKVSDCFERSLNGKTIDIRSREMLAFVAYLRWIGKNVSAGIQPQGSGIKELPFLDRPANPVNGKRVFMQQCQRCHGKNGKGVLSAAGTAYIYPPLWGNDSYNSGASIFRISKMAGYVKYNMPFDASVSKGPLNDSDAWDVAAYINSRPRPLKNTDRDWPNRLAKPYDYPFGPYADSLFSSSQRKYGPYAPIKRHYASLTGILR